MTRQTNKKDFINYFFILQPFFPFIAWEPNIPPCAQPNLDYMGPESTLTRMCERSCDIYSLGILIFSVFNNGKPLFECQNQPSVFRKNAEEMRKWRGQLLGKLPEGLQDIVKLMLNTEPTVRPDPDQLSKVKSLFMRSVGSFQGVSLAIREGSHVCMMEIKRLLFNSLLKPIKRFKCMNSHELWQHHALTQR